MDIVNDLEVLACAWRDGNPGRRITEEAMSNEAEAKTS
jgi:hypothetical protein